MSDVIGAPLDIRPPALPLAPPLAGASSIERSIRGIDRSEKATSAASGAAPPTLDAAAEAKIKSVAGEFEAMILGQLLQPMFESLDSDGLFGGGSAERMFRPMLVEQYANNLAKAGGVGLAAPLAAEIIRLQTMQNQTLNGAA